MMFRAGVRGPLPVSLALLCSFVAAGQKPATTAAAELPSSSQSAAAQQHLSRGIALASQKHYKAAQAEFEKANSLQPGDFAILFNLGQVELSNGDNLHAEEALSRGLKLKPQSPETLYLLAQVYANESRSLDALDLLAKARALSPANPDILYLMAQIGMSQRYYEDAIPLLENAVQLAPKRTDIATALGESYFKSDNIDKTITVFSQLLQSAPSVTAHVYLGLAHVYLGRFDEAKQDFANGLKLEPNDTRCLFQLGYIAKLQGDAATAEALFTRVLRSNPDQPNSLLELATIRMDQTRFSEAAELLKRYVAVSKTPATGYYKLAMAERSLHNPAAAQQYLTQFQTLSKDKTVEVHPYEHLFDYVDSRAKLAPDSRAQQDIATLVEQETLHPDQPEVLYALAAAYLKGGRVEEARRTIEDFERRRPDDARTLTGLGVLLARYGLYDDSISRFKAALESKPDANDTRFDLANAYFRKGSYADALAAAQTVSDQDRKDESYSTLLADIQAHLGNTAQAESLYRAAIERSPDNDQNYLSLALLELRGSEISSATSTLKRGQARVPGSGKLAWGLGLCALLEGDLHTATKDLEFAVDLLPEWPGSYATLGFFYYQTGQIVKAKEVLDRFKDSGARGGLDVNRIAETLAKTPVSASAENTQLSVAQRAQIVQFAIYLADKTL